MVNSRRIVLERWNEDVSRERDAERVARRFWHRRRVDVWSNLVIGGSAGDLQLLISLSQRLWRKEEGYYNRYPRETSSISWINCNV